MEDLVVREELEHAVVQGEGDALHRFLQDCRDLKHLYSYIYGRYPSY